MPRMPHLIAVAGEAHGGGVFRGRILNGCEDEGQHEQRVPVSGLGLGAAVEVLLVPVAVDERWRGGEGRGVNE